MSKYSHWAELTRSLPATSIDPLSETEIAHHVLVAGTRINHALAVLAQAEKDGSQEVVVEARTEAGWTSFQRVKAAQLRAAIE